MVEGHKSYNAAGIDTIFAKYGVIRAFLLISVLFSFYSDKFFMVSNLVNILNQSSLLIIASLGMAVVLLVGGIDLSIGANISCTALISYLMIAQGRGTLVSILAALLAGILFGLFNAYIINKWRVLPLVATLATSFIIESIQFIVTNGGACISATRTPRIL
jgi:ribose transport system permease protein